MIAVAMAAGVGASATSAWAATAPIAEAFDDPKMAREVTREAPAVASAPAPVVSTPRPAPPPPVVPAAAPALPKAKQPVAVLPPKVSTTTPAVVPPPVEPKTIAAVDAPPPPIQPAPVEPLAAVPAAPFVPPAPSPVASLPPAPSPSPVAPGSSSSADVSVKAQPPAEAPPPRSGPWPYAPRMKVGYRRFSFTRRPTTGSATAVAPASESFESFSLDFYPISSYLRVGFSSQFGWESGQFQRTGDYFLAESASTGFQIPGRFTPFAEAFAGAGYMRRLQGTSSSPTLYWQTGIDAGVEVYFAKRAYVSVAVGYLHPGNLYLEQKNLSSVNLDTWSLKVGLGI